MSKMNPRYLDEHGIAAAVTFLIVMSAVFGLITIIFTGWGQQARLRGSGLIDVMRQSEKRQKQLLTLTYVRENANADTLKAYLFNYGSSGAKVDRIWIRGDKVNSSDWSITKTDGSSLDNKVPPKKLVVMTITNLSTYVPPEADNYAFVMHTESNAVYSWLLGRGG